MQPFLDIGVTTYRRWLVELTTEYCPESPTTRLYRIRGFSPDGESTDEQTYYSWKDARWMWDSLTGARLGVGR